MGCLHGRFLTLPTLARRDAPFLMHGRRRSLKGYVEDSVELRTKLGVCFSILLNVVFRHTIAQRIAGHLQEAAGFGDVA